VEFLVVGAFVFGWWVQIRESLRRAQLLVTLYGAWPFLKGANFVFLARGVASCTYRDQC
jgi:hypothetical protein